MRIQYGNYLTLGAIFVATAVAGSSIDNVLAGMSKSDLDDIFNQLTAQDYSKQRDYGAESNDYDYDYDNLMGKMPVNDYADVAAQATADSPAGNVMTKSDPGQSAGPPESINPANTMLPAYCDPPNPCPIGYTSADGCIENFENTSEFSRRYQASQNCICDTEHMFDCPEENVQRGPQAIAAANILADVPGLNLEDSSNPYLGGPKLNVAAKKGIF